MSRQGIVLNVLTLRNCAELGLPRTGQGLRIGSMNWGRFLTGNVIFIFAITAVFLSIDCKALLFMLSLYHRNNAFFFSFIFLWLW